jgi:hypothetical protein
MPWDSAFNQIPRSLQLVGHLLEVPHRPVELRHDERVPVTQI